MKLVEFVPPTPHPLWKLCPQMGINDVVVKVNPDLTGLPDPWRIETLSSIVSRLKSAGLNVVGLEGDPFDMCPIKEYGARVGENSSSWRKEEQIPLSNSNSKLQLFHGETVRRRPRPRLLDAQLPRRPCQVAVRRSDGLSRRVEPARVLRK